MKYTQVLKQAFGALKSGSLWGFATSGLIAIMVPFGIVAAALWAFGFRAWVETMFDQGEPSYLGQVFSFEIVVIGGMLLALPVLVVLHGGTVHLTGRLLEGLPIRMSDGWSVGLRRLPRVLVVEVAAYLVYVAGLAIGYVPFVAVFVFAVASAESAPQADPLAAIGAMLGGICCGYAFFFLMMLLSMFLYQSLDALLVRSVVIGGERAGAAIRTGARLFRARFKQVLVFWLITTGLLHVWQMVTSVLTTPVLLLGFPFGEFLSAVPAVEPDPAAIDAMMARMFSWFPLFYGLSILVYAPVLVFLVAAWTAFFRHATGMEGEASPDA